MSNDFDSLYGSQYCGAVDLKDDRLRGLRQRETQLPSMGSSFAFVGRQHEARLAHGVRCPYCEREWHATDVRVDDPDGRVQIICSGCHESLLLIEDRSGPASAIWEHGE